MNGTDPSSASPSCNTPSSDNSRPMFATSSTSSSTSPSSSPPPSSSSTITHVANSQQQPNTVALTPNDIASFFSHVKNNHYQQVVDLVRSNSQYLTVRTNDEWKYTPLLWATQKGHTQLVQFFLEKGCPFNEKSEREYWVPILLACRYGFLEIVKLLHQHGQDLNEGKENDMWYPLHWAAYYNRLETGRYLLENGALLSSVTKDGSRPIHFAALQGHGDFIRLLIEFGEKPDVKQPSEWAYTPLMWCAQLGHFDCVKMLVKDFNVDISHQCGKISKTAAGLAEMYSFPEISTYLIEEEQWRAARPIREMAARLCKIREKRQWFDIEIICQQADGIDE